MVIEKGLLVKSFERRYDYYSARAVYAQSLASSGLKDKDSYTSDDVANICAFLESKSQTEGLIEHLQALAGITKAPPKKVEAKPAAKKAEAKPEEKKAEAKPAAKKPEPKPAAKKPEPKPAAKKAASKPAAKKASKKGKD
jgi:outer membrane biosynthesis protein TonB